jgi:hypothetical protein
MARLSLISYRIASDGQRALPQRRGKFWRLKALAASFLVASVVIGLFLAALVIGSFIAALCLIAIAAALVVVTAKIVLYRLRARS